MDSGEQLCSLEFLGGMGEFDLSLREICPWKGGNIRI